MNQTSLESSLVCLNSQNNWLALNRAAKGSFIKMWAFTDIGYAFCTFCARCGPEKHNLFSFSLSPDAFSQIFFSLLKWTELCGESRCTSLISVVRERYILGFLSRLYFLHKAWQQRERHCERPRGAWRYDCCCPFCTRLCLYPLFHSLVQDVICFWGFLSLSINSFSHFLWKKKKRKNCS